MDVGTMLPAPEAEVGSTETEKTIQTLFCLHTFFPFGIKQTVTPHHVPLFQLSALDAGLCDWKTCGEVGQKHEKTRCFTVDDRMLN